MLGVSWAEMDLSSAVRTVPATRMKAGREHRIPLSQTAVDLLQRLDAAPDAERASPIDAMFASAATGRPLSAMAMLMRRMQVDVHNSRRSVSVSRLG